MLPLTLYLLGASMQLGAILAVAGLWAIAFVPQLLLGGVLLLIGLAIERWRYKPLQDRAPDRNWTDTGERFTDPQSGVLVAVYFDAASGERHYVQLPT